MAEGWKLNEGSISFQVVSEDQLWTVVVKTLSSKSMKTTTYKFALLRAILENLYKTDSNLEITFLQLAKSFAKLYWNLVIENEYSQGQSTQIEKELKEFQIAYKIPKGISFDSIIEVHRENLIEKIEKKILNRYVIGALFEDIDRIVYGFSKKEKKITLTQSSWEFLLKYQTSIYKLVNYELAKFLQDKNPYISTGIVLEEIENITKRESLRKYQQMLLSYSENECFYTGKILPVIAASIAVDHFVPWSFVHSDELWNFVLTSQSLNSKKGSKLPAERYLDKIHVRNQHFLQIGDIHVKSEMEKYEFQRFKKLYQYAEINGFEKGWTPS
ncbi:HNH endonuclease domain-containing protein [Planococcus sp. N028]|uniref:HNH endonuclease domain-containing protein n=1 Tax=Planococcus shixiaomingii TaxID=3058393 RepID=A0ABT8N2U6_9BACL|nr:HNH endonuclease domain-containing protein [Planococcus sp. N028]MDN7242218.1 HNH endonuclease domain-containing protein [Planococcus sp. N028]